MITNGVGPYFAYCLNSSLNRFKKLLEIFFWDFSFERLWQHHHLAAAKDVLIAFPSNSSITTTQRCSVGLRSGKRAPPHYANISSITLLTLLYFPYLLTFVNDCNIFPANMLRIFAHTLRCVVRVIYLQAGPLKMAVATCPVSLWGHVVNEPFIIYSIYIILVLMSHFNIGNIGVGLMVA